jgi:WD40 repeat protein
MTSAGQAHSNRELLIEMKTNVLAIIVLAVAARLISGQTCNPPTIAANANSKNLFTPQQEMVLGDLTVQKLSGEFRQIRDPKLLAYINSIGSKIIKHLPPTGLTFHFHIIDYPEANAFNIPGGHIFVTRKLIALANSEDELAGVIGHELGHATVHHGALDMSEAMRRTLKITSLGDEKDVTEKYNLLIENARMKRAPTSRGHEDDQQLEADKIGFYAMVAAGYDPDAVFTLFDRLTESEGKTGGWFSDIFGNANPEKKRLREMAQATDQLPQGCRDGRSARPTEEFLKWQADVVMFHESERTETLPGLILKRELSPKLRSDITSLSFSKDGRLLLAQDDFGITVIDRPGMQVLFQIPAEDADSASITDDNKYIVFVTNNLRFERWDIAQAKPIEARELVLKRDCYEHQLSPDGNYLACVDTAATAKIIETKTGKKVWEKQKFYELTYFEYLTWIFSERNDSDFHVGFFRIKFSPDSHYAIFSRSNKYRFRLRVDGLTQDSSENSALALDLTTMKNVGIGGDIKKIAARPYDFIDNNHLIGSTEAKLDAGGLFSFPDGKRLERLQFGGEEVKRTPNSNYVVVKPLANADCGLYDIKHNTIVAGLKKKDVVIFNDIVAMESTSGKIIFRNVTYNEETKLFDSKDTGTIDIPAAVIGGVQAAEISDNFSWLAISSKTRGGLWDLSDGSRKVFTRGFRAGIVDQKGYAVGDFPKFFGDPHTLALLKSTDGSAAPLREMPEFGSRQYGRFVLNRRSTDDKDDKKSSDESAQYALSEEEKAENKLKRNVTFELKDFIQDKIIWTRDFKGAVPRFNVDSYSGRLVFYWWLGNDEGKAKLKEDPALKEKADALGVTSQDYIVEVVDAYQQKTIGMFPLETGKGSFSIGSAKSEGAWLTVHDSESRILVYSIKDGSLRHRFFGNNAAVSPSGKYIAVENFPGEITLYSLETGERIAKIEINGKAVFLRFNLTGDKIFVLNDAQNAYIFDVNKIPRIEDRLAVAN